MRLAVNAAGDLVAAGDGSRVLMRKPLVYQTARTGIRQPVASHFTVEGHQVRFQLGTYDHDRELVIDPTLAYSTLLGGNTGGLANPSALAVDLAGNAYITGEFEGGFPATRGAFQTQPAFYGTFITKVNANGTALLYSTYLDTNNQDGYAQSVANGIAVNAAGEAYVAGQVQDPNLDATYPTTPGAYQRTEQGGAGFITKLTADGSGLVFSTLFGSSSVVPLRVALDSKQNVVIAGLTNYGDVPTTRGVVQPSPDSTSFLTKLDATGSRLLFSTYIGSTNPIDNLRMVLDDADEVYLAGNI